jgi:hypothetical protein
MNYPDADFAQLAPNCTMAQVSSSGSVQSKLDHFINQSCFVTPTGRNYYQVIGAPEPPGTCGLLDPTAPCPASGTAFGNTRPGIFRGPGQNNTDLSLIKNFSMRWPSEKAGVEFRAEMFNAFNHPQFLDPGIAVDGASFGEIRNTSVAPRIVQFALKLSF